MKILHGSSKIFLCLCHSLPFRGRGRAQNRKRAKIAASFPWAGFTAHTLAGSDVRQVGQSSFAGKRQLPKSCEENDLVDKRTLHRLISLLAALVMAVSLLTGCGTKTAEQVQQQEDAQTIQVYRHPANPRTGRPRTGKDPDPCHDRQRIRRRPPQCLGKRHEWLFVQTHRDRRPCAGAAQNFVTSRLSGIKKQSTRSNLLTGDSKPLWRLLWVLLLLGAVYFSTSARTCSRCGISSGFAIWPFMPAFSAF